MANLQRIYMDHAASTPIGKDVENAMKPYWSEVFGNPNALHKEGREARQAVDGAREKIAGFLNVSTDEIIFTSGGTEANALAIIGFVERLLDEGTSFSEMHFITSTIEHPSALDCFKKFEERGASVNYIGVDEEGIVKKDDFQKAVSEKTVLVSVMHANNEIGTIQPVQELSRALKKVAPESVFHTDASQTPLFMKVDVRALGADLVSVDAQKLYGPKGVGALFVKRGISLRPINCGGSQEKGLRPGTQYVPGIVGFAKAFEITEEVRDKETKNLASLRDHMIDEILKRVEGAVLNGSKTERLANNVNISFPEIESEFLVTLLDEKGIAVSSRSACLSGEIAGSYVVAALDKARAKSAVRFSLGRSTTREEVDYVIKSLEEIFRKNLL